MKIFKPLVSVFVLAAFFHLNLAFAEESVLLDGPRQVVQETADKVLSEVTARKDELDADSSLIYPLVEKTVVPHFDFARMARSAMGRFWRNASSQQQRRIVAEFQELLVLTYATALLNYSGQEIEYPPMRVADGAIKVLVPTKVRGAGGPPIPINYRLRMTGDGMWLVYDVVIDSVSLVTNYRSSFAREIQKGAQKAKKAGEKDSKVRMSLGIDSLVNALASKNDGVAAQ